MKRPKIKLPFGLDRTNTVIHINDVKSGKQCNCVCPSCGSALIAAKGTKKQHHFKHASTAECETGLESAIHLAAKRMIKEKKQITLPSQTFVVTGTDSRGTRQTDSLVLHTKQMAFDSADDEVELHGMKADILALRDGRPLIIEICYRHKVDDEKLAKIADANISAIEIDLSDLSYDDVADWTAFWARINDPERARWLHNAKAQDIYEQLEKRLSVLMEAWEREYEREDRAAKEQQEKEKDQLKTALAELNAASAQERIDRLAQGAETHRIWRYHRQYLPFAWNELPEFLNVQVPNGDWIYGCDRRLWQVAIYSYFICKQRKPFCVRAVDKWLQQTVGCNVPRSAKTVGIFGRRYPGLLPAELADNLPSTWKTVSSYCDVLCRLRVLSSLGPDERLRGNFWFTALSEPAVFRNTDAA